MTSENRSSWSSMSRSMPRDLQDVSLDEDGTQKGDEAGVPVGRRPACLKGVVHECVFVALIAFSAASSVFLQRSIVILTNGMSVGLNMTPAQLAWATAAPGLATGAFLIPLGHMADTMPALPRKTVLLASLTVFAGIVACSSLSPNGLVLDLVTGLAGIACAAHFPIAVGILSLVYPVPCRRKNIVFSSFLAGNPAATVIGSLSSGALASLFSWKAPFICLGLLYAAMAMLGVLVVPSVTAPVGEKPVRDGDLGHVDSLLLMSTRSLGSKSGAGGLGAAFRAFDWLGMFLLLTGVLLLTVALTIGPEGPQPWKTPTVILLICLGLLSFGCFVVWEKATKMPMIPPSIWQDWSLTLTVLSTLSSAMSFYSAVFWLALFLQKIEKLDPFQVAVRMLPQALVGLLISPLVGLIMHKMPGSVLLAIAGICSVVSNVLLVFVQRGGNYFVCIFPSLMLSTIGMDWTMNVASLYMLSTLPLRHHSIGASLLQTTTRLAVPLGMAVTTAVWSSYVGKGGDAKPELPYLKVFVSTVAFASFSLVLVPFISIGKQGEERSGAATCPPKHESDHRPSRRWSIVDALSTRAVARRDGPPIRSFSLLTADDSSSARHEKRSDKGSYQRQRPTAGTAAAAAAAPATAPATATTTAEATVPPETHDKVLWVVCEECGSCRNSRTASGMGMGMASPSPSSSSAASGGDPIKYFNDIEGGGAVPPEKQNHEMIMNGSRRRFPLTKYQNIPF